MKENIFELNVIGWECYCPVWFRTEKSKTAFKKAVREAIHSVLPKMMKKTYEWYDTIDGHDLQKNIIPILEKNGFKVINPDFEIRLEGDCKYERGRRDKPSIISREDWKTIIEHNEMAEKLFYAEMEKKHKNRSKKQKTKDLKEEIETVIRIIASNEESIENLKAKKVKLEKQLKQKQK